MDIMEMSIMPCFNGPISGAFNSVQRLDKMILRDIPNIQSYTVYYNT